MWHQDMRSAYSSWRAPQQMLRTHRSLKAYCATLWWRRLVFFPCNGAPVECNWQEKTEVLGKKPVPVPLCPPQIPHGPTRDRTWASAMRGRVLTAWAMARPFNWLTMKAEVCKWHVCVELINTVAYYKTELQHSRVFIQFVVSNNDRPRSAVQWRYDVMTRQQVNQRHRSNLHRLLSLSCPDLQIKLKIFCPVLGYVNSFFICKP
jgi:hypothetical protein